MSSCRSFVLALILVIISAGPVRAWGCAGPHIVALIAKQHLSARALEATAELLESQPIDPRLPDIVRTKQPTHSSAQQPGRTT